MVVAMATKHADERPPELGAVAPTASAEIPRAALEIAVRLGVQVSIEWTLVTIKLRVLGMHVEEQPCLAELSSGQDWIATLPEQV